MGILFPVSIQPDITIAKVLTVFLQRMENQLEKTNINLYIGKKRSTRFISPRPYSGRVTMPARRNHSDHKGNTSQVEEER
jgi:hypothetical protein